MKICLVSDHLVSYSQSWSGAELVCQYLASLLEKGGEEVFFLTLRSKKKETPANILPTPALIGRIWFFKEVIPLHIILRTVFAFYYLKKLKPDIIHLLHTNSLFIPVMISAKLLNIPTTFTVLDYFIICPRRSTTLANGEICERVEGWQCLKCVSILRLLERRIIRLLAKNLNQLITFTETSKSRLIKHGFPAEKIKVKYIYEFSPEISDKEKNQPMAEKDILFVGSFHKHKGLHILIQALPHILDEIPEVKMTVVGRGNDSDTARVKELVEKLNLKNNIEFLGQKKNEEIFQLIFKSKVVVVPEQWLSDFGPLILLETMALGKPVVASKIGSIPEFIKEGFNGFLAEYNKPEKFAQKIISLLENKEMAKEMGNRARESVQSLFEKNQAREILKLYQGL